MDSPESDHLFAAKGNARPATASRLPAKALLGSIEAKLEAERSDPPRDEGPAQPEMFPADPDEPAGVEADELGEPASLLTIDLKRPRIPNLVLAVSDDADTAEGADRDDLPGERVGESEPETELGPEAGLNGTVTVAPAPELRGAALTREPDGLSPLGQAIIAGVAVACLAGGLWYAVHTSNEPALAEPQSIAQAPTPPVQESAAQEPTAEPSAAAPDAAPDASPETAPQAAAPAGIAPSFDLVRIEPDGHAVFAGRAAPGASLIILDNAKPIGTVKADSVGEWAFVPDKPLPQVDHDFSLVLNAPQGAVTVPKPAPDKPGAKPEIAPGAAPPPEAAPLAAPQAPVPDRKPSPTGGAPSFGIQLASVSSQQDAAAAWQRLHDTYPALLDDMSPTIEPAEIDNQGLLYRVRAGNFGRSDQAETLCRALRAQDQDCIVVQR